MTAAPATRAHQSQRALMGVRELIISGEVPAGTRLHEVALSARLGISAHAAARGLAQLGQEGLVDALPAGGYAVRGFPARTWSMRSNCAGCWKAPPCVWPRSAARHRRIWTRCSELLTELDTAMGRTEADMQFERYIELNAAFHSALVGARQPHHPRARSSGSSLPFASPSAFLHKQADVPAFRRSLYGAQAQHRSIVEAIAKREGGRAEALAREHARTRARQSGIRAR